MANKLNIFLIFAGLHVHTSVGHRDLPGSCAPMLGIKSTLETIHFAEVTDRLGYVRSAEVILAEISAVFADKTGKGDIQTGDGDMRAQIAENTSYIGPMNAVLPNTQTIKIIQPDFDAKTFAHTQISGRWQLNKEIFDGIKAAQGDDLQKAKDAISKHSKSAVDIATKGVQQFFSSMTNGSKPLPDHAKSTIACMQKGTELEATIAMEAIFEEINTLAEALHGDADSKDKVDENLKKIIESHKKATNALSNSITHKFQVLRNIAAKQYLDQTELVTGLFAIESAVVV